MFRLILPALLAALPATAQQDVGPCHNTPFSQKNCVRVLACVGDQGHWFDGRARGWGQGTVSGYISDDTYCEGTWDSNGPLGTGRASLTCADTTKLQVIYYNQDNNTGTVIGQGRDTLGRHIRVWSGENVLQFLTSDRAYGPALPCVQGPIPVS